MLTTQLAITCSALMLVMSVGPVNAQNKCAGEKIKAAAKKAVCKTGLEAKQTSAGGTIDPAKVAKCEATFSAAYAKQEAKGECLTTNDAAAIEAKVDAFVDDVDTDLSVGTLPSKCQGEKLKAAGKKAECKLALESKQAGKGGTIDPAKVAKCEAKLSSTYAKQEAKGPCNTTGDAATIEAKVDAFIADVDLELNPPPVSCGDSNVVAPETCDDGNTSNNDNCPSDCIVDPCTPNGGSNVPFAVNFTTPVGVGVAGMTVLLDYPESKLNLPGSGGSIPAGIITDFPSGASAASNDFDHALRQLVSRTTNMPAGLLFRVHYESCQGALAATPADFTCTVLDASDAGGNDVSGVTCTVSAP
jgi:cysteine-rich repeat protein